MVHYLISIEVSSLNGELATRRVSGSTRLNTEMAPNHVDCRGCYFKSPRSFVADLNSKAECLTGVEGDDVKKAMTTIFQIKL